MPRSEQRPGSGCGVEDRRLLPAAVFPGPQDLTWHDPSTLHVVLVFKDTFLPYNLAPNDKPNILSGAQLEKD